MEKACFAMGCFWGVEATYRKVKGVVSAISGYTGGHTDNPTYEQVCAKGTGHAEAVEVEYDPSQVSYDELLKVFWTNHNPCSLNRQGPDHGDQYRSAIFFHNAEQEKAAKASMAALDKSGVFKAKIVTQIAPAPVFWKAEEYHQRYHEKHGIEAC